MCSVIFLWKFTPSSRSPDPSLLVEKSVYNVCVCKGRWNCTSSVLRRLTAPLWRLCLFLVRCCKNSNMSTNGLETQNKRRRIAILGRQIDWCNGAICIYICWRKCVNDEWRGCKFCKIVNKKSSNFGDVRYDDYTDVILHRWANIALRNICLYTIHTILRYKSFTLWKL